MRRCLLLLLVLSLLGIAQPVHANGLPVNVWWPSAFFVPNRATAVGVISEQLTFDFTPNAYPTVTARYMLENRSAHDETLTIAFLYLQSLSEIQASWQGQPVSVQQSNTPVPSTGWEAPDGFPAFPDWESHWLDPGNGQTYAVKQISPRGTSAALFPLTIAAGDQGELVVSFVQGMTGCDKCTSGRPLRHFTYLLSPARYWAFFGDLTIRVTAPTTYQIATDPQLTLEPGSTDRQTLTRRFEGLPSGEFHLTTRPHTTVNSYLPWAGLATVAVGIAGLAVGLKRRRNVSANAR